MSYPLPYPSPYPPPYPTPYPQPMYSPPPAPKESRMTQLKKKLSSSNAKMIMVIIGIVAILSAFGAYIYFIVKSKNATETEEIDSYAFKSNIALGVAISFAIVITLVYLFVGNDD